MKKIITWAPAAFAAVAGCQKNTTSGNQATEPVVKTYIKQFMNTTSIGGSDFSPYNSKIPYSRNETGIYNAFKVAVAGGDSRQLTNSTENPVFTISYFPKDERILYSSDKGGNEITHLYVRQPDGSSKDLTPEESAKASFVDWNHDQNSFFFLPNKCAPQFSDLYEMDVQSLTPKLVRQNGQGLEAATVEIVEAVKANNVPVEYVVFDNGGQGL
jgi:Tol biopolymer transport system component